VLNLFFGCAQRLLRVIWLMPPLRRSDENGLLQPVLDMGYAARWQRFPPLQYHSKGKEASAATVTSVVGRLKELWRDGKFAKCYEQAKEAQKLALPDTSGPAYWRALSFQSENMQLWKVDKDEAAIAKVDDEYKQASQYCQQGEYADDLHYQWAQLYRMVDKNDEAIKCLEWVQSHYGDQSTWKQGVAYYLARLYAAAGRRADVQREMKKLEGYYQGGYIYDFDQCTYFTVSEARYNLTTIIPETMQ